MAVAIIATSILATVLWSGALFWLLSSLILSAMGIDLADFLASPDDVPG
jgi:hypothetical protein